MVAFKDYLDGILDIMTNDQVINKLAQPEILFFGPDENSADKMDVAYKLAESRG